MIFLIRNIPTEPLDLPIGQAIQIDATRRTLGKKAQLDNYATEAYQDTSPTNNKYDAPTNTNMYST